MLFYSKNIEKKSQNNKMGKSRMDVLGMSYKLYINNINAFEFVKNTNVL